VSQKSPTFDLLQCWHRRSDYDNFGRRVTKKVRN